jgi:hypothetical protein
MPSLIESKIACSSIVPFAFISISIVFLCWFYSSA